MAPFDDYSTGMVRRPLAARLQQATMAPSFSNVQAGVGMPRRDPGAYTGSLDQQYAQAFGIAPRYVAQNPGAQRLNTLYDSAFGYR